MAILALFGLVGVLLIALGERLGRSSLIAATIAPLVSALWVCLRLPDVVAGRVELDAPLSASEDF